ncbi:LysR family transcriptional regulator [Epibacterium sp. SM1979]|uniref:LysR family transcriptional regulator n=1 Tax=Tritonibacter litoralis TaxID=2662264 RepID=A0A843YHI8_9RHOB|nr:LysR family transcriptional regulator [Tritonibacter litoralis]
MQLDWDDIRVFLEIERTGRLSQAGKRLGVSHTTVARRLRQLEDEAGCTLFEPSQDGLVLTEAGALILEKAQDMENAASAVADMLGRYNNSHTGRVRVGAPDGFGNAVLSHVLPELIRSAPGYEVELVPVPAHHKLWRRDVDIAVSLDRPQTGRVVMRKLIDYDLRLYAHPDLLPDQPLGRGDLIDFPFVGYIDALLYTAELDFNRHISDELRVVYKGATVKAQLDAVRAGIGMGVLPCFIARNHGLVPVLPDEITFCRSYWLLYPEDYKHLERIRTVSGFIYDQTQKIADLFRFSPDGEATAAKK